MADDEGRCISRDPRFVTIDSDTYSAIAILSCQLSLQITTQQLAQP